MGFTYYTDLIAIKPIIHVFEKERYTTKIGSFFSLVSVATILVLSIYFCVQMFSRSTMQLISSQQVDTFPVLNITTIPFFFGVQDGTGNPITADPRAFSMQIIWNEVSVLLINGTLSQIKNATVLPLENCNVSKFGQYQGLYDFPLSPYYCIHPNDYNLTLYGLNGLTNYSYLQLRIQRCINSTINNNCYDTNTINNAIYRRFFFFKFFSNNVDNNNVTNPFGNMVDGTSVYMDSWLNLLYDYYLKNIQYETDYGYVFQNNEVAMGHQTDIINTFYTTPLSASNPGYTMNLRLFLSQRKDYYLRSYAKLQTLLANIGGVIKGILLVATFFVEYIGYTIYNLDLANNIFSHRNIHINKGKPNLSDFESVKKSDFTTNNHQTNSLQNQ